MGYAMVSGGKPDMAAPVGVLLLSSIAEGSIVKLNENGSPVEFYVAKHDYESVLNGAGRTLLVRKNCYDSHVWHTSNVNAFATSSIDTWLNGDYKALLAPDVQSSIGTTKFYYTPGNGITTVNTLERSVFILSYTELSDGVATSWANIEGTNLPIRDKLQEAQLNGVDVFQWTRTPDTSGNVNAFCWLTNSGVARYNCTESLGVCPCFTLPSGTLFDAETLEFVGVA